VSAAVVTDLRASGKAQLTFLDAGSVFGQPVVKRTLSGTLARVEPAAVPVRMLVNGRMMDLPTIHALGRLAGGGESDDLEIYVLDDPDNPILLRSRGPGFSSSLVRIEFPEPPHAEQSLEHELAAGRPVDVYGVYFSFNSADIRPESERVLREIADLMTANPDWHLRIDGHTDGIGNPADNLELSRRRAAAVKSALVQRYRIAAGRLDTDGRGMSSPKDRNDTPEGRARNRRVELRRE
jgi:hypothetical protein